MHSTSGAGVLAQKVRISDRSKDLGCGIVYPNNACHLLCQAKTTRSLCDAVSPIQSQVHLESDISDIPSCKPYTIPGFLSPTFFLTTYARTMLGANPFLAALTVILVNGATAIGFPVIGSLTDRLHVTTCIMISTIRTVLGVFFLWGFATHLATLYVFSVIYGLFAGSSYTAAWPGIIRQLNYNPTSEGPSGGGQAYDPTMILGILTAGRGIGNIISGPLSGILLKKIPSHRGQSAWNSGYSTIVAFTGSTALIGGVTFLCKRCGWIR